MDLDNILLAPANWRCSTLIVVILARIYHETWQNESEWPLVNKVGCGVTLCFLYVFSKAGSGKTGEASIPGKMGINNDTSHCWRNDFPCNIRLAWQHGRPWCFYHKESPSQSVLPQNCYIGRSWPWLHPFCLQFMGLPGSSLQVQSCVLLK